MNTALYATTPATTPAAGSAPHGASGLNPRLKAGATWFEKVALTLVEWQNRTTQRGHLREIDDRLLSDMGITRADAEHESRKPFWRA